MGTMRMSTTGRTTQPLHHAAIERAEVIRPVRASLIEPERTTAISTAANAQAASVPC